MGKTAIEWTDITWNPTTGCDQVSPGCDNCYALTQAGRLKAMGSPRYQKDGDPKTSGPGFALQIWPDKLSHPFTWSKPSMVFVDSMSDLFHPDVPTEFIEQVFAVMRDTPQHTYQVLTKRPQRMASLAVVHKLPSMNPWPENVWPGTSVESARWLWRVHHLHRIEGAHVVRMVSAEPLLGPLDDLEVFLEDVCCDYRDSKIGWVIVGGESGANHRPIEADWVRDIRDQCADAGVPFFFKQWGGRTAKSGGRTLDGRVYDSYPPVR